MTEQSMFFADGSYYSQTSFAKFIKDIFNSGVVDGIDNELAVSANSPTNMAVQVKTGRSYVRGYIHEITTNPVQLTIATAHASYARIDRVVLHLDTETDRSVTVQVKTGTPASSPSAPTLTQTDTVWEISLAQVYVSANATVITSSNITDERTFMTFQEDNLLPAIPIGSKTTTGIVKIGNGIDVSNGVISVSGVRLLVNNTSRTNSGTFAVGTYSYALPAASSGTISTTTSRVIANYTPTNVVITPYNEFSITDSVMNNAIPTFNVNITSYSYASGEVTNSISVYRTRDSALLGSGSVTTTQGTKTGTCEVTLPSDWVWGTDTLYINATVSTLGSDRWVSCSITSSTVSGTVYFVPTTT